MTELEMWNLVVGFLSATFVLPIIQQPSWSPPVRSLVTFAYSILAGIGVVYFTDGFAGSHDVRVTVTSILYVFVAAIGTYYGLAKPSGIAPAIEGSTSPTPRHRGAP